MWFDAILKTVGSPLQVISLDGGANNRVYKFEFENGPPLVCKQYFLDPNDLRLRLKTEYSFLQYAWSQGIRTIPEPVLFHPETNSALYSFLQGRRIYANEINDSLIQQFLDFFLHLNQNKEHGVHLSKSSEGCFSLNEFFEITEKRIGRLLSIQLENDLNSDFQHFVGSSLFPKWVRIKEQACKAALHSDLLFDKPLSLSNLCISPSDFGFHNALFEEKGKLAFIDFEYAGWDDPCKTVCDFFCQPKIPIPIRYFHKVAEAMASVVSEPENCLKRIEMIFPVMQLKWCCIFLNVFTQVGKSRRLFSFSEELDQQEKQLILAKELYSQIQG